MYWSSAAYPLDRQCVRPKNQKQTAPRVFTAPGATCFKANKLRTILAGHVNAGIREGRSSLTTPSRACASTIIPLAIQQARIEVVIDRGCDTDAFEIPMFRIEKEICVGGTNRTG